MAGWGTDTHTHAHALVAEVTNTATLRELTQRRVGEELIHRRVGVFVSGKVKYIVNSIDIQ